MSRIKMGDEVSKAEHVCLDVGPVTCPECRAVVPREEYKKDGCVWCDIKKEKKMVEEKALEVRDPIVMPAVTPEKALSAWKSYQDLKSKIIEPSDIQVIQSKQFLKKSYWRKIATFFNLSVECIKEERAATELTHHFTYKVGYKVTAPNGRIVHGDGACSSNEKAGAIKTEHTCRSTAHTRAFNRAVSNCVGGGEVSAEEIHDINGGAIVTPPETFTTFKPGSSYTQENIPPEARLCSDCNIQVSDKVAMFSKDKYNKVLCFPCQQKQ